MGLVWTLGEVWVLGWEPLKGLEYWVRVWGEGWAHEWVCE